jgi:hypothetical protein
MTVKVGNLAEAEPLAGKILGLEELEPYKVALKFEVAP